MFVDSTTFSASTTGTASRPRPDRLAELVHHLGEVPLTEARRAILQTGADRDHLDPLSVVAGALVQLRREARARHCLHA